MQLIISNDQAGMEAARKAVFTGIPWQICRFHPQQKSLSYVPGVGMRMEAAEDVRSIFNVPDQITAQLYLEKAVSKYTEIAPKLADWMEVKSSVRIYSVLIPTGPSAALERFSQEIKWRTRVVRVFPNEQSCMRLVSATLMEVGEEWK